VLKKQKTLEELRAKRAVAQEATLKARKVARKEAFVRAEKYIKEYSAVSLIVRSLSIIKKMFVFSVMTSYYLSFKAIQIHACIYYISTLTILINIYACL
jgi:hypothetical protein